MITKYYKSLDRPLNIFGLRGNWLRVFGIFAGASVILGIVLGIPIGAGAGMGIFIGLLLVSFFICLVLQSRMPSKRLPKMALRPKMEVRVVRRETLMRAVSRNVEELKDNKQ